MTMSFVYFLIYNEIKNFFFILENIVLIKLKTFGFLKVYFWLFKDVQKTFSLAKAYR